MKDFKYLAAYSIPLIAFLGVFFKGLMVFATPVFAFIALPILEVLLPVDHLGHAIRRRVVSLDEAPQLVGGDLDVGEQV